MKATGNVWVRAIFYAAGLVIMTLGVALSVKADLGVSTISSIPYTMNVTIGMELGLATSIFSVVMVLLQIAILGKKYPLKDLLQIPVGFLFGIFLTFCCGLTNYIPPVTSFPLQLILTLLSTVLVALGVFLYVHTGFVPLAPEGFMLAIAKRTGAKFANVKLLCDIAMVVISLVACLLVLGELGSVGIGTILAALLVGTEVKILTVWFGSVRDKALGLCSE